MSIQQATERAAVQQPASRAGYGLFCSFSLSRQASFAALKPATTLLKSFKASILYTAKHSLVAAFKLLHFRTTTATIALPTDRGGLLT